MDPKIIEKTPMSMLSVKDELKKIKERDGELNFRANKANEYLEQFQIVTKKAYGEISKDLESLGVPRLKDIHVMKIIDIMPKTVDELKVILQGYTVSISNDNMKKIVDVVTKHAK